METDNTMLYSFKPIPSVHINSRSTPLLFKEKNITSSHSTAIIPPTNSSSLLERRRQMKNKKLSLNLMPDKKFSRSIIRKGRKTTNIYDNGPVCIMPYLYIGNESNALKTIKKETDIRILLNVAAEVNHSFSNLQMEYKKLAWTHSSQDLIKELEDAVDYIDKARQQHQPILVHCQCGIARSAVVIIAYIMKIKKISLAEAYDCVKQRSPIINPNLQLMYQLREFEAIHASPVSS
ncbi:dual specificity phosphatase [Pilobolus umbonatus]|nr:dual specificity phosphatase [Pilobolus umbonatus]